MEVIKVGICLDDKAFGKALAMGLARESSAMQFFLLDTVEEGDFCDLILSSADRNDPRTVQMVRNQEPDDGLSEPPYRVYRYRESQNLINDLLFIYFRLTGKTADLKGNVSCRLAVFLSDSGGCGATSTALSTARMLYRLYGSRSLYLNLCPFDGSRKYLAEGGSESLLKLLYYLDQEKNFPLESFITKSEELDYINTGIVNTYFNEMQPVLLKRFLEKADKLGIYDFIIVDIGNHLCRAHKRLLACTDIAVLVSDGERKLPEEYRHRIQEEICKRLEKGRLILVENFAGEDFEENTDKQETYLIGKQSDGEIRLEKQYGIEISAVARDMMEGI